MCIRDRPHPNGDTYAHGRTDEERHPRACTGLVRLFLSLIHIFPMDDFFKFREKALVSATPILPSDPRFESQGFKIVDIRPTFKYRRPISICLLYTSRTILATVPMVCKSSNRGVSVSATFWHTTAI